MKIPVNGVLFSIIEVDGPISRNGMNFPVRVRYNEAQIDLLKTLPEEVKKYVLAAAVSEACRQHRIPLIRPKWI